MIADRNRGVHTIGAVVRLATATSAYWLWIELWHGWLSDAPWVHEGELAGGGFLLLGILIGSLALPSRGRPARSRFLEVHRFTLRQCAYGLVMFCFYLAVSRDRGLAPTLGFAFLPVLYLVLLLTQAYVTPLVSRWLFRGQRAERILLVGRSFNPERLEKWLASKEGIGFRVVGALRQEGEPVYLPSVPVLGTFNDLERVVREHEITQVILVALPRFPRWLRRYALVCERLGVRLLVVSDFEAQFGHAMVLVEDEGMHFMGLREEPLENPFNQMLKRALDLAVAIPVTLLVLPFTTLVVWMFQRWQSPGPIFHLQARAGLQNRPFNIIKYRSMHVHQVSQAVQATTDDPRIFPAGRWMRRFSVDELPQFLNVLKGEMSVVGPRPHLIEHNDIFARALANYHVRAMVKPGITGLAQVRGFRGGIYGTRDTVDRVTADIQYLENWSFMWDCWLILKTVVQVFRPPKSAY